MTNATDPTNFARRNRALQGTSAAELREARRQLAAQEEVVEKGSEPPRNQLLDTAA